MVMILNFKKLIYLVTTEGNATFMNIDNCVGSIGFLPIYTALMKQHL
jgi:hypothetical protein